MNDLFYLTSKKLTASDMVQTLIQTKLWETVNTYEDNVYVVLSSGSPLHFYACDITSKDFDHSADQNFLSDKSIKTIFCLPFRSHDIREIIDLISILMKEHSGYLGHDLDGFEPYFELNKLKNFYIAY